MYGETSSKTFICNIGYNVEDAVLAKPKENMRVYHTKVDVHEIATACIHAHVRMHTIIHTRPRAHTHTHTQAGSIDNTPQLISPYVKRQHQDTKRTTQNAQHYWASTYTDLGGGGNSAAHMLTLSDTHSRTHSWVQTEYRGGGRLVGWEEDKKMWLKLHISAFHIASP